MKLIVGLGNSGKTYRDSRHNIGFLIAKALSKSYKIFLEKDSNTSSITGKGKIQNSNAVIALPLTFMNFSGVAVSALLKKYKIDLDNLLVVCDDLDLEFGKMKIKPSGSSGGHRGLQSIIEALKSKEFSRLRVGIARPSNARDITEYVLSPFSRKELLKLKEIIGKASDCCRIWIAEGTQKAMNIFNRASQNAFSP